MKKGLYFMGWQRDMWNYHPSLPMKNMHMIEDILEMHGNMLIWSCLGSGAIGLPYLALEAEGTVPPRMRLYGYMNDREFCKECMKRGIRPFAVLWKAQLWEFAAEWNEEETQLLAMNIHRDAGVKNGYVGMRELSVNRYPHVFPPVERFFPQGLTDYKGNRVGDFLEEFKAVSLQGRDILARWLMAPGHDHKCYSACANKDSYLIYLKKEVELMIDADAGGLHIDEYDSQKHVLNNAGCFCQECVDKFASYLRKKKIPLPADAGEAIDFDYRAWLLQKGYTDRDLLAGNGKRRWDIPLFREYARMQMDSIEYVVRELAEHARAYARRQRGEAFPVSANLFNCYPHSWNCKKHLDILAGEKTDIGLRQDGWYQFAFGWLNGKECCFVEDPNQYVRDMAEDVKKGINDRFILFLLEPLAHGFHLAFPYGSWLQNQVKDALWPDLRMLKRLGTWLDEQEEAFGRNPAADLAVIYDWQSASEKQWIQPHEEWHGVYGEGELPEELGAETAFGGDGKFDCFFRLLQKLSDRHILYRVIYESPDEPLCRDRLDSFGMVLLPDAFAMRPADIGLLREYQACGGQVITVGQEPECAVLGGRNFRETDMDMLVDMLVCREQEIVALEKGEYGIAWHITGQGRALHIVNYRYDSDSHRIRNLPELSFRLEKPWRLGRVSTFPENPQMEVSCGQKLLEVKNAGIYTVIEFENM